MKFGFKFTSIYVITAIILGISGILFAGTVSNNTTPVSTGHTLTDIYNLIHNNSTSTHDLSPNLASPINHSISEIYLDLANLINASKIVSGVTYLGVTGGGSTPAPLDTISPDFSSTTPGNPTGYTLTDIYNLIQNRTDGTSRIISSLHSFSPASSPANSSSPSLDDIYTSLSTLIQREDIASDTTYLGVAGTYETPEFCGGDGSSGDPYQICSWTNLNNVRNHLDSYFILNNDLSSTTSDYVGTGNNWNPIGDCGADDLCWDNADDNYFAGNFDGNNYSISDLVLNSVVTPSGHHNQAGLFSSLTGSISNVGLNSINMVGNNYYYTGGLVGNLDGGTISNSYTTGIVSSSYAGGLAGNNTNGNIVDSYSTASVSGYYVGGLVGFQTGGSVSNSYAAGSINASSANSGGLIGYLSGGIIDHSYYDSDTSGQSDTGKGTAKTTLEMKALATYVGWNINGGATDLNNGYPYLGWQDNNGSYVWLIPDNTPADPCTHVATDPDCWSTQSLLDLTWGPYPSVTSVSGDEYNLNGKANTDILYDLSPVDYPAAKYCYELNEGAVPDGTWYLPSKAELRVGWEALGLEGFPSSYYWSSSENWWEYPEYNVWVLSTYFNEFYSGHKDYQNSIKCLR